MEKIEQNGRIENDREGVLTAKVFLRRRPLSWDLDFQVQGAAGVKALGQELSWRVLRTGALSEEVRWQGSHVVGSLWRIRGWVCFMSQGFHRTIMWGRWSHGLSKPWLPAWSAPRHCHPAAQPGPGDACRLGGFQGWLLRLLSPCEQSFRCTTNLSLHGEHCLVPGPGDGWWSLWRGVIPPQHLLGGWQCTAGTDDLWEGCPVGAHVCPLLAGRVWAGLRLAGSWLISRFTSLGCPWWMHILCYVLGSPISPKDSVPGLRLLGLAAPTSGICECWECVNVCVKEHNHVPWENVQTCVRMLCTNVYLCVCECVFMWAWICSVYLCDWKWYVCVCVVWVYVCTFMRVYLSVCLCAYDMYLCGVCLYVCVRMIVCAHVSMCACGCSKLPGQLALRQIWLCSVAWGPPVLSLPLSHTSAISSHQSEDWEACVCTLASPYEALATGSTLEISWQGFLYWEKF